MFDDRYYTNKPVDLREDAKTIGLQHFDEEVAKAIKEVVNIYGIKEDTYTEYDKQPEIDPLFQNVSYKVGVLVKGGRVLHGCRYYHNEDEWYYGECLLQKFNILRWWYEEDKLYEI